MKNIQLLKWISSLSAPKQVVVILLIVVGVLFTLYMREGKENNTLREQVLTEKESRRVDERQRTDSFNNIIKLIQIEYSVKYEQYLIEQLNKFDKANKIVNQTIDKNAKLLKQIRNVK